jgi:hypothetical protein
MSYLRRKRLPLNQPEFTSWIVKMRPDNCEVSVTIIRFCNSLKERKYVEYTKYWLCQ